MIRPHWNHEATSFQIDILDDHKIAAIHFQTNDDADHTFLMPLADLERLRSEIDAVLPRGPRPAAQQ
jgi:hypothetical protein